MRQNIGGAESAIAARSGKILNVARRPHFPSFSIPSAHHRKKFRWFESVCESRPSLSLQFETQG
jgi:hypothetical protein